MTVGTYAYIGDQLPALSLPSLDGSEVDFEKLRGKRHLLFFWGSW